MKIVSYNERWYPLLPHRNRYYCYLVVLTKGEIGDYAAYAGIVDSPESYAIHQVAKLGNKIPEEEARVHFPGLPEDINYRM